ncbi:GNAT family N-acetyltransferase [Janibacter cremeus]|uniref:GNAT superfamily N-acetyltransferase n=1 Tax=Janibacter cremeus TaxID=1285192 RepID=A0A852VXH2_9MICO|nr:GNAT family N-acetyltransferase [Janibacter cremeus]NYF98475.1 GNAT superfamily N-acetyltransferase [Janibacter cremeus]
MSHPDIRPATPGDLPDILRLVHELAVYEREPDAVEATEADFAAVLFPTEAGPTAFCHVVEADEGGVLRCDEGASKEGTRRVVGMALWFLTFSTWTGQQGIHLEDLFVEPEHRGSGLGKALLVHLAQIATERGHRRLEWTVLRWNEPAIAFYESLAAAPQVEWETYRLDGDALAQVGTPTPSVVR